jgi:hypothetical protein
MRRDDGAVSDPGPLPARAAAGGRLRSSTAGQRRPTAGTHGMPICINVVYIKDGRLTASGSGVDGVVILPTSTYYTVEGDGASL